MRALRALFLVPLIFLGACNYSGVVQVSGNIYLSDGVTPFPSASGQLEAYMQMDGDTSLERSENFVSDPQGGYSTAFFFDYVSTDKVKGVQLRMAGATGVLIEDLLMVYSANFQTLVRSTIRQVCVLSYVSRWYQVPVGSINQSITQDIVVDITPVQLAALRTCQQNVLNDYLTGAR